MEKAKEDNRKATFVYRPQHNTNQIVASELSDCNCSDYTKLPELLKKMLRPKKCTETVVTTQKNVIKLL